MTRKLEKYCGGKAVVSKGGCFEVKKQFVELFQVSPLSFKRHPKLENG